jgi:5-formyltetrahydrofolate cyclo-ligase
MSSEFALQKSLLRRELRGSLKEVSAARRAEASAAAQALLAGQPVWRSARSVLGYAARGDEIDLQPLLQSALADGKVVGLPRFLEDGGVYGASRIEHFTRDCAVGKFGVLEPLPHCAPLPLNVLDLVLVPGLGFDAAGHRLGRGAGYYDRLLGQVTGIRCGVAFDDQIRPLIPTEQHDIVLNCILTPTRWLEITGRPTN